MDVVEEGTIGRYRPTSEILPDPPPYPGDGRDLNHFEVKIAPEQMNGETHVNGMAAKDSDDRLGAELYYGVVKIKFNLSNSTPFYELTLIFEQFTVQ